MICITNASTDRRAIIAHCSHEAVEYFADRTGMHKKLSPVYPMIGMTENEEPIHSKCISHWIMEPSALKAFYTHMTDRGMSVELERGCQWIAE